MFTAKLFSFLEVVLQESPVRLCGRLHWPMAAGDDDLLYFFHQLAGRLIDAMAGEFFQDILGGGVIGVDHIDVEEAIVAKNIDDQLIGGKVPDPVEFIYKMVDRFDEAGFTAVVLHYPIARVPHGADGEEYVQTRVEME